MCRFEKGVPAEFVVEYAARETTLAGFRVGFRTPDTDALLEQAVAAAAEADVAIVCVGTTEETETEGHDRAGFTLPGRQDELIRRVAAANAHAVVVVNAGSPVDMAWADDVAAVLQCWFGGQEMGGALADVARRVSPIPADGCQRRFRCGWGTVRPTRTSRGRTASSVMAKVCSWATAALSTTRSRRASRLAMA